MVQPIMKDVSFLKVISQPANEEDAQTARDLLETLIANSDGCVGMAANMIGVSKRIIAFEHDGGYMVMFNPEIIKFEGAFQTQEGCLSLEGVRDTKRYKKIKVRYQNERMQTRIKTFSDFAAQIIQHEIDHCNGIII